MLNLIKCKAAAAVSDDMDQLEGTMYAKYSVGALSVGAQRGVVNQAGANDTSFDTTYLGISYAVSDNLSVSYNEIESRKITRRYRCRSRHGFNKHFIHNGWNDYWYRRC